MAVTETPRLKLKKQDSGDLSWHTALNSGMDNADARVLQHGAASPVGVAEGQFVGQLYYETGTSPPTVWICTVIGTPGTWIQVSQLPLGAVLNHNVALRGKDSGGTAWDLIKLTTGEIVLVGSSSRQLKLITNSGAPAASIEVAGLGIFDLLHTGNIGALGLKAVPTRLWTKKASSTGITTSQSAEKIIASFDRLDFPGVKDGANKYMLRGKVSITNVGAGDTFTARLRVGATGNGLTDTEVERGRFFIDGSTPESGAGLLQMEVTPGASDRVTLTVQRQTASDYTIEGTFTSLEISEVLD